MFDLLFFVQSVVEPLLRQLSSAENEDDRPKVRFCRAALFEAVLWIRLGVSVKLFPIEASTDCVRSVFQPLYQVLNASRETTEFAELESLFPFYSIQLRDFSNREFHPQVTENNDEHATAPFRSIANVAGSSLTTSSVQKAMSLMIFADPVAWSGCLQDASVSAKQTSLRVTKKSPEPADALMIGFFEQLDTMFAMKKLLLSAAETNAGVATESRHLQEWRMSLRGGKSRDRFDELRKRVEKQLEAELAANMARHFSMTIDELLNYWSPQPLTASM